MNHCSFGHETLTEIRWLPLNKGASLDVCHAHYLKERESQRARGWTTPAWDDMEVYAEPWPEGRPCVVCGDTETELHPSGRCGNCGPSESDRR